MTEQTTQIRQEAPESQPMYMRLASYFEGMEKIQDRNDKDRIRLLTDGSKIIMHRIEHVGRRAGDEADGFGVEVKSPDKREVSFSVEEDGLTRAPVPESFVSIGGVVIESMPEHRVLPPLGGGHTSLLSGHVREVAGKALIDWVEQVIAEDKFIEPPIQIGFSPAGSSK